MLDLKEISYQPQTGERKIIDNLNLKVKLLFHFSMFNHEGLGSVFITE